MNDKTRADDTASLKRPHEPVAFPERSYEMSLVHNQGGQRGLMFMHKSMIRPMIFAMTDADLHSLATAIQTQVPLEAVKITEIE